MLNGRPEPLGVGELLFDETKVNLLFMFLAGNTFVYLKLLLNPQFKYMFDIFTFIYSSFTGILRTHNMTSSQLA